MAKRLGIMGGTFNPIHAGHICIARIAQRELELDEVRFIPTGDSPHKGHVQVSGEHRLNMVRLAVAGQAGFTVSDMELRRAGFSYTCDTLKSIRMREPDTELFFILGWDMFCDFANWRNPDMIVRLAKLAVVPRPGVDALSVSQMRKYLRMEYDADAVILTDSGPDISSTEIRRRLAQGEASSLILPNSVAEYVSANGLYRAEANGDDIG